MSSTTAKNAKLGALITEFQNTEQDALFSEIVQIMHPYLLYYSARLSASVNGAVSADDLYAEGLIGLLNAARRYAEDNVKQASFTTFAVAHIRGRMLNTCAKSNRTVDTVPIEEARNARATQLDPESNTLVRESQALLSRKLEALPDEYVDIFIMRSIKGLTFEEISNKLNLSRDTIRAKYGMILDLIRELL